MSAAWCAAVLAELREQSLDLRADVPSGTAHVASVDTASVAGLWIVCRVFPGPRYMCTPHGRHGSKLRTARMMSMPLKLSGGFSSKIGVFWTASSYGPGVPYTSRTLAFHGVGGYGW